MKKILILLSTYNGEKHLTELLDSLEGQSGADVDILVRDDGSTDQTIDILSQYNKKYKNIKIIKGKNFGYAKSFWVLVRKACGYDYYAFCDQDDVWDNNKIAIAVNSLDNGPTPLLYTSAVRSVDDDMNVISENTFCYHDKLNVYESFQRSIVPGCVMVFNEAARRIMAEYDGFMESHDWSTYAIVNTFGKIVVDKTSHISYRVNSDNTIGVDNGWKYIVRKLKNLFRKKKCTRSRFAKDFYDTYNKNIPKKYVKGIKALADYKKSFKQRMDLFWSKDYHGFFFKLYVLLGRV